MALKVLHGNGPVFWVDRDHWCPSAVAIQDVLIPSRTLRSMENLDHFAVFRQWTYEQLYKMTHGPKVDEGWQMDAVEWRSEMGAGTDQRCTCNPMPNGMRPRISRKLSKKI